MSIEIKVTDEMIRNARELAPCPLTREEMRKMLGAAVRIVERDLNQRQEILDAGGTPVINGCIEDVIN